jgi:hypothetical protein
VIILTCAGNNAAKTVTAALHALADFKNPYATSDKAVRQVAATGDKTWLSQI